MEAIGASGIPQSDYASVDAVVTSAMLSVDDIVAECADPCASDEEVEEEVERIPEPTSSSAVAVVDLLRRYVRTSDDGKSHMALQQDPENNGDYYYVGRAGLRWLVCKGGTAFPSAREETTVDTADEAIANGRTIDSYIAIEHLCFAERLPALREHHVGQSTCSCIPLVRPHRDQPPSPVWLKTGTVLKNGAEPGVRPYRVYAMADEPPTLKSEPNVQSWPLGGA
ncbi:hypothetical protein HPB51_029319 [Rhipicephalus microplus]|uniref:Uncharacterized protein n=1 Tax=Rhipicephalus microplus TaxID=6941 RepID=A0A9J6CUZ5_RHIMP|nr:hypothetical protein HPB51_029319 [Rhipicephalus microplus]